MVKVLLPMMALTTGMLFGVTASASKALAPGDQIVRDFAKATGFRQWVGALTKYSIPGDYQYIEQTFKVYPNLTKDDSLPKLNFEKDTFQIREGLSQVTLQYFPEEPHTFAINGQRVEFGPYELASQKMRKILSAMNKGGQASSFLLLPVAWAQDSQKIATKRSIEILSMTSAITTAESPAKAPHWSDLMDQAQDTSAWKNFAAKNKVCVQKIHDVENVVHDQQLDFNSMECTSMGLKVHLGDRDFVAEKGTADSLGGFYVEIAPNGKLKNGGSASDIHRFSLSEPDTMTKGYGDDPVAMSSSPAQRDQMGGEFTPDSPQDKEMMD